MLWFLSSGLLRYAIWGFLSVAVLGGLAAYRAHVYRSGWNAALQAVAAQNEVARQAAKKVEGESDACFERGGEWDVAQGRCLSD